MGRYFICIILFYSGVSFHRLQPNHSGPWQIFNQQNACYLYKVVFVVTLAYFLLAAIKYKFLSMDMYVLN